MTNPVGRPRLDIDPEALRKLCRLNCTVEEIAAYFECNKKTIERRMAEDESFSDIVHNSRSMGKLSVRRQQFKIMEGGNPTMAIWLGKQLLGQSDKREVEVSSQSLEQTLIELAENLPE
tara:strand:+ start:883 stop:1239 length:357 start_codon:yes stop_codon:yes gene_type:complete